MFESRLHSPGGVGGIAAQGGRGLIMLVMD